MNWQRRSKYHMTCDEWTLSKAYVRGKAVYSLWRGEKLVSMHPSANEAKKAAEEQKQ